MMLIRPAPHGQGLKEILALIGGEMIVLLRIGRLAFLDEFECLLQRDGGRHHVTRLKRVRSLVSILVR